MPTPLQIAQHRWDNANPFDTPEDDPKSPCCQAELIRRRDGSERCVGCDRIFNTMNSNPKRKFHLNIQLGADERVDLVPALEEIIERIREGGDGCIMGGPTVGWFYKLEIDEEMTHERYFAAINARNEP